MNRFSFDFNGRNSRDMGLLATSYDFLLPPKRQRKQAIPFRSGTYDYGAKWYDDRILRVRCVWISEAVKRLSRADIREISYWLSAKGKITLAVEPDKYYVGELFDGNDLVAHYDFVTGAGSTSDGEFELDFQCEPFAYKEITTQTITNGTNDITYAGTAETPATIIVKNPNNFAVQDIKIVITRRR